MSQISSRNAALPIATNTSRLELLFPVKVGRSAGAAVTLIGGKPFTMWQFDGQAGGRGTAPTSSAANPTRATAGALGQSNPGGGRQKWLVQADAFVSDRSSVRLYDRLAHIGSLDGTVTTAQTISSFSAPAGRYDDGVGNTILLEILTQIGATPTTVTASYTDQAGNAGHITQAVAIGGTNDREIHRTIELPLASGDTGVRSVQSVTLAGTTGTAGSIGVVLAHYIWEYGTGVARPNGRTDLGDEPGFIEAKTDACWYWVVTMNALTALSFMHAELGFLEA